MLKVRFRALLPFDGETPARIARFAVALALTSAVIRAFALEPEQLYAKVAPSIVVVEAYNSSTQKERGRFGSGVIVAPGQIVTNCHVIQGADVIYLRREKFKTVGVLRYADPDRDLCQVGATDIKGFEREASRIASVDGLRVGQKVYAIGTPEGLELTFSGGMISSLRAEPIMGTVIQTDAPISKGSSGGGLFDTNGQLIGITTRQVIGGQNLNFAVPAPLISDLAARHKAREAEDADTRLAQEQAVKDISAWARDMAAKDPNYQVKQTKLLPKVIPIMKRYPSSHWLTAVQDAYDAMELPPAPTPAQVQAMREVVAWSRAMAAKDRNYAVKQAKLLPKVGTIMNRYPPSQWLMAVQDAYDAIELLPEPKPNGTDVDDWQPEPRPTSKVEPRPKPSSKELLDEAYGPATPTVVPKPRQ